MTVLGYFNSLRELGGARRILEEEVRSTVQRSGQRKRIGERRGLFRDRKTFSDVVELTSRVSTAKVAQARRRLSSGAHEKDRVDSAIATNMISVGLDITRLGLMVVLGQPKTHAEYIQATSRVGRSGRAARARGDPAECPQTAGPVPLREVPPTTTRPSTGPWRYPASPRSQPVPWTAASPERSSLSPRHTDPTLTPPNGVEALASVRTGIEQSLIETFVERVNQQPFGDEHERLERLQSVRSRIVDLLDSWLAVVEDYHDASTAMKYQRYEPRTARPLLREMLEEDFESPHHRKFRANRSLRDVEPEVNLYISPLTASRKSDSS